MAGIIKGSINLTSIPKEAIINGKKVNTCRLLLP